MPSLNIGNWADWLPSPLRRGLETLIADDIPSATSALLYGSCLESRGVEFRDVDLLVLIPSAPKIRKLERTIDDIVFDVVIVPQAALDHLVPLSLKAEMAIGLFALAQGEVIAGEFPDHERHRAAAIEGLQMLSGRLKPRLSQRALLGRELLRSAAAEDDAKMSLALSLIGISETLVTTLADGAGSAILTRSMLKRAIQEHSDARDEALRLLGIALDRPDVTR